MSRWSPETFELNVDREGVALRKAPGTENIAPMSFESLSDDAALARIPLAIETYVLQSPVARRNLRLRMGSGLVRYKVVPWHAAFTEHSARLGFARHCFVDTFGEVAHGWNVQTARSTFGEPSLAAAIPEILLQEIESMAQRVGVARMSIEPELLVYFQRFRSFLRAERLVFVFADLVRISFLLIMGGKPVAAQVAHRQDGSLATLLERSWQAYATDAARPPVFVVVDGSDAAFTENPGMWQITVLPNRSLITKRSKLAVGQLGWS